MNVVGLKTGQRCDVPYSSKFNVVTLGPTSRCYREDGLSTSRHYEQHRDVPKRVYFQRCDVEVEHRDVTEGCIFNVATLGSNVVTLQRMMFSTLRC